MYSYLHRYHAGNIADVHKHSVLVALLDKLKQKSTPFCVLDAFAGEGLYPLNSVEARRNQEHKQGIERLFGGAKVPKSLNDYLNVIRHVNDEQIERLNLYPGSPKLIQQLIRESDRLIAVEGHPNSFANLKQHLGKNKQVHLHQRDAHEAMKALLPFTEKRGLVFIDPSYEVKNEYTTIIESVYQAYEKMPSAVFAIWYPILNEGSLHKKLIQKAVKADFKSVWICEWNHEKAQLKGQGLIGSGMLIINKPWQLENTLTGLFIELNKSIYQGATWFQKTLKK